MLNLDELFVTQLGVRNPEQVHLMTKYVKDGGFFTKNSLSKHQSRGKVSPLIAITQFEDGKNFIHDGHHRAASILLGGRDFLDGTEYCIRYFKYNDYLFPNLKAGWWTPFNPLTELRLTDMADFKKLMHDAIDNNATDKELLEIIANNRQMYSEPKLSELKLAEFVERLK